MASLNLNAITENATRLGTRLQETISEHTREFTLARTAGTSYFDMPEDRVRNIRNQLDSSSDREKLDAMKRLLAVRTIPFPAISFSISNQTSHTPSSFPKVETSPSSSPR